MSRIRLAVSFLFLFLIFGVVGIIIGALVGNGLLWLLIFLTFAALMNVITYFFSYRFVLWSYRAKEISEEQNPKLFSMVRDISQNAGLPMPKIAIADIPVPNAFATGRSKKKAYIVFTGTILNILNERELRGVIGHELGHIKHNDILVVTIAATIASALMIGSRIFGFDALFGGRRSGQDLIIMVLLLIAAIGATLLQLAISRQRELYADEHGAKVNNSSEGLISALMKLEQWNNQRPMKNANPATASLFIVNPGGSQRIKSLFSTHPPTEERIKRLRALGI
ncbi:MAG: M48 family metalloprotease [Thermoplasmatales archaeon]